MAKCDGHAGGDHVVACLRHAPPAWVIWLRSFTMFEHRSCPDGIEMVTRRDEKISKTVAGFWVRRGFKSLPLRSTPLTSSRSGAVSPSPHDRVHLGGVGAPTHTDDLIVIVDVAGGREAATSEPPNVPHISFLPPTPSRSRTPPPPSASPPTLSP